MRENPLLTESTAPFGAPAFDKIQDTDYAPAFEIALERAKADIQAIIDNPDEPTFENTIEALEFAGADLTKISGIFYAVNESCTSDVLRQTAEELSPKMTEYSMFVTLNPDLFNKVKAVYEERESLDLTQEQAKLLEDTYKSFARNGANLSDEDKAEFSKLSEQLSMASLKYGRNILDATNAYTLHITDEAIVAELPDFVKDMASSDAKAKGLDGWLFTLNSPSIGAFLKYSTNRELKEEMWRANNTRCIGGDFDNTSVILNIADLRIKEANLLGYKTFGDYAIETRMAKTPETVMDFLNNLMEKTLPAARRDVAEIQEYANANGFEGQLMPWDFSYWSEKYQDEKYSINTELLKPYFELSSVQAAIFDFANKLYGLNFTENKDIPVYHPDVKAYEVTDENGRFMGLLYFDFFPRESKRGGAWMTSFRDLSIQNGVENRPFVTITTNFTKPTETTPALLTFDEFTTLLHEFGHGLHGLLAEGSYPSLTGTSVARDFVELPSQINENWTYEAEYLQSFAKHYQTGEVIPTELINKIIAAKNYLAGYLCVRQIEYGLIDMGWNYCIEVPSQDVVAFERDLKEKSITMPLIDGTAMAPAFNHIFSGGYAAGYYSYKWAEVLEADAFSKFKENGIFNREIGEQFKKEILSRGSIEDADVLFRNFMGRDPNPDALIERMGMK